MTSEVLTEAFQTLDHYDVFQRENSSILPFALLDGHLSRLELPFLKYINTPKENWVVCIGVPYGTTLWQVGDSKGKHGSFNIAFTIAKQNLLEYKESIGLPGTLEDNDPVPLINCALNNSFARVEKNKNAISDRGWNPLIRCILINEEL